MEKSAYKTKWYLFTWNCPNDTKDAKKARRKFHKLAQSMGSPLYPLPKSACARMLFSRESVQKLIDILPPDAECRHMEVTDKQIERTQIVWGNLRQTS